ncbi:MAG: hypothetical protein QOG65_3561 [Actinomycetota bacterium]|jgi:hypothetical protein|nr:hypothetical protein [Actinomycetota bacterium]
MSAVARLGGHACKRNEFGRVDPKGTMEALPIRKTDVATEVELG